MKNKTNKQKARPIDTKEYSLSKSILCDSKAQSLYTASEKQNLRNKQKIDRCLFWCTQENSVTPNTKSELKQICYGAQVINIRSRATSIT